MPNMARKPVPAAPDAPPGSLAAVLATVPDPRRTYGWRPAHAPIPLVALLEVPVAATLCAARRLYTIAQWAEDRRHDAPALLEALVTISPRVHHPAAIVRRYNKPATGLRTALTIGRYSSPWGAARAPRAERTAS